jgi:hypothetical protein
VVNRDLPDIFHITSIWAKTVFGALVVGAYFAAAGWGFHKLITGTEFNRKIYQRMSLVQYLTLQLFLILMLSLPIKILIRLVFRIKYVWVTKFFNV